MIGLAHPCWSDAVVRKTESLTYHNLYRPRSSAISGHTTIIIAYASNACPTGMKCRRGNITSKTDAGTYAYTNAKIYAVTQINPSSGNFSSISQSLPTYTSFLQPASLSEGTNLLTYTYGSDENRIKGAQTGITTNTRYFFGDYEKDITGGTTKHIGYRNP